MEHTKRRFSWWLPTIVVTAALFAGAAWTVFRAEPVIETARNVVLISIDTCRPDHLSCYGYPRKTTPRIDELAGEGVLFENVVSPAPTSLPAHCSMMTGTIPPFHGVHADEAYRLEESNVTLAETLKEHGFVTGAIVGAFVLDPQHGLSQGFDSYYASFGTDGPTGQLLGERNADAVTESAVVFLRRHASDRFFLFVHYHDPHHPYAPPKPYASALGGDAYAGEIAYVDHAIGGVIDQLKQLGLYDSTLVVVTSDHGEGRGEHGELQHGYFIYNSTTRVPLVVKPAGAGRAHRVTDTVALIDIMPTVLSSVGVGIPTDVQGEDLTPYFSGRHHRKVERFIYSESLRPVQHGCSPLLCVETRRWKYIQTTKPELYDLSTDPDESENVIHANPAVASDFAEALRGILKRSLRTDAGGAHVGMDEEIKARIDGLGSGADTREDPKNFFDLYQKTMQADFLFSRKRFDEAERVSRDILAIRGDVAHAHNILGRVAFERGDFDEAVTRFSTAVELSPLATELRNALGNGFVRQGNMEAGLAQYRETLRIAARADKDETIDRAMTRLGRVDPGEFQARLNIANVLHYQGDLDAAIADFRDILRMNPLASGKGWRDQQFAQIHYQLGAALADDGRAMEAALAFRAALQLKPDYPKAQQAIESVRKFIRTSSPP